MMQKNLLVAGESVLAADGTHTLHYLYHPKEGLLRVLIFYDRDGNAVMLSYRWKTASFPYTQVLTLTPNPLVPLHPGPNPNPNPKL